MRSARAQMGGRSGRQWEPFEGPWRPEDPSFPRLLGSLVASTALVVVAATILLGLFEPVRIRGESMLPTLADGDFLAVTTRMGAVRRGVIVVIARPDHPSAELVKRVVAVPGDLIPFPGSRATLGPDQYWVVGDNADASTDSRDFGPIDACHLRAQALCVYWPPTRWAWLGWGRRNRVLGS